MIIAYNGYLHAIDETAVVIQRIPRYDRFKRIVSVIERWILSGLLFGDTPALVTTAVINLEAAYGVNSGNLALLDNNASTIYRELLSNGSLGGVNVTSHGYPIGSGAEYTTYRTYSIVAEVEYPATGVEILDWYETLQIWGGADRFVIREPLNGDPIKQTTHQKTAYHAIQSGSATGRTVYPSPASPIWPNDLHRDRPLLTFQVPDRLGIGVGQFNTDWTVSWNYEFEAVSQLNGQPTPRPF